MLGNIIVYNIMGLFPVVSGPFIAKFLIFPFNYIAIVIELIGWIYFSSIFINVSVLVTLFS